MGVHLRKKQIANGKLSLYLDFYPPVKGANGKLTRREYLNKYVYEKPKNAEEKLHNRENLIIAEGIKNNREKEILNEQDGIFNTQNKKRDFLEFFEKLCEKRKESEGNYGNWLSALQYLRAFTGGKCKMADLTEKFCENFKDYLLHTDRLNTVKGLRLSQNSALSYFNKFRCAVKDAYDARLLNVNPLRLVKGIEQKKSKREFLTQEELQLLAKTPCDLEPIKNAALFSALGASPPWPAPDSAAVAVEVAIELDASVVGPEVAMGCPPRAMRSSSAHTGTDGKGWLTSSRAFLP
jgi:hypothetical protein